MGCCQSSKSDTKLQAQSQNRPIDISQGKAHEAKAKAVMATKEDRIEAELDIRFKYDGVPVDMNPYRLKENLPFTEATKLLHEHLPSHSDYGFLNWKNEEINEKLTLKEIFQEETEDKKQYFEMVHYVEVVYHGLDIPENMTKISEFYQRTTLIGNPVPESNPFELRIYNVEKQSLANLKIKVEDFEDLLNFSHFSAYCNGDNYLYMSGGDNKNSGLNNEDNNNITSNAMDTYLKWVIKIDLSDGTLIKLDNLNTPRFWHSMVFVPSKYVFFVGGNFNKTVEVLNTETGEIREDSQLNEYHSEPSLCLVNQVYLYCFMGFKFHDENYYSDTIERCNLRRKTRQWEIVNYTLGKDSGSALSMDSRYFAVSYFTENKLIFLGGENINTRHIDQKNSSANYIFDIEQNNIESFDSNSFEDLCPEKFFIPVRDSRSVMMPLQTNEKIKVFLFSADGKIEVKEFEEDADTTVYDDMPKNED